jgi:lysophospholipase L1-like esterase
VLPLRPDLIVVCQLVNDLNNASSGAFQRKPARPQPTDGTPRLTVEQRIIQARDKNLLLHHIVRMNLTPLVTTVSRGGTRHDEIPPDFAGDYEQRLGDLVNLARSSGANVALCTAWRAFSATQPASVQEANGTSLLMTNPHLSLRGFHAAFDAMNQAVRNVAEKKGVLLIDVAALLPAESRLFRDAVHVSADGEAALADILAAKLTSGFAKEAGRGVQ